MAAYFLGLLGSELQTDCSTPMGEGGDRMKGEDRGWRNMTIPDSRRQGHSPCTMCERRRCELCRYGTYLQSMYNKTPLRRTGKDSDLPAVICNSSFPKLFSQARYVMMHAVMSRNLLNLLLLQSASFIIKRNYSLKK
jgi:hypothetical protein